MNTPNDIAVMVFTSALKLRERALSVQNTWLRRFPRGHLIGGYHADDGLNLISLGEDIGEDYASASLKQYRGLERLFSLYPEASWFYITGCDAYVYADKLCALLDRYDPEADYYIGGHFREYTIDGRRFLYPCGGPGFALSRSLTAKLVPRIPELLVENAKLEAYTRNACDVTLTYFIKKYICIEPTFAEGFYQWPEYDYPESGYLDGEGQTIHQAVIAEPIAFHQLRIREMYLLDAGHHLKKRTLTDKLVDKATTILTRKLRTKSMANRILSRIYGHRRTS